MKYSINRDKESYHLIKLMSFVFAKNNIPDRSTIILLHEGREKRDIIEIFSDRSWPSIPDSAIIRHPDILPFFTDEAFYYFLPAFVCASIRLSDEDHGIGESIVSALTKPEDLQLVQKYQKRISLFNEYEKRALLSYGEFLIQFEGVDENGEFSPRHMFSL